MMMKRSFHYFAAVLIASVCLSESRARADGMHTYILDMKCRQLMLDDRIPFASQGVKKIYPQPKDIGKPVLEATYPYEKFYKVMSEPHVMYDAEHKLFRMWYWTLYWNKEKKREYTPLCYAESSDGLTWTKPILGNFEYEGDKAQNNIISNDLWTPTIIAMPPGHEYTVMFYDGHSAQQAAFSKDGRKVDATKPLTGRSELPNIKEMQDAVGLWTSDGYRLLYDPVWKKFLVAVKSWAPLAGSVVPAQWRRTVALGTSEDGYNVHFRERMVECDLADDQFIADYSAPTRKIPEMPAWAEIEQMSLYRYEGLILGFPNFIHFYDKFYGGNEATAHMWWTYDWKNWSKPREPQPFLNYEYDTSYWGFSKGVGPMSPVRVGNELWIYRDVAEGEGNERYPSIQQWFTLAKLRVDGWAGYEAGAGVEGGWLDTQEFVADGEALKVNANCSRGGGALRVEVYTVEGPRPYPAHLYKNTLAPGFVKDDCEPTSGDVFGAQVKWKSHDWSELKGKRVRLRFYLNNATIYSFWTKSGNEIVGVQEASK
jgi:hypothetical protein